MQTAREREKEGDTRARARTHAHTHTHIRARTHTHTISEYSHRYCNQCPEHKIPRGKSKNQKVELHFYTKYTQPGLPFPVCFRGKKMTILLGLIFVIAHFWVQFPDKWFRAIWSLWPCFLSRCKEAEIMSFEVCSLFFLLLKETYSVCLMLPVCCCFIFDHNYTDAKC